MLFLSCSIFANAQNRTVSLSARMTLKEAFIEIEKQTGLSVDYNDRTVNTEARSKRAYSNAKLSDVLTDILGEINCTYTIQGNHILVSPNRPSQERRQIAGTVTDTNSEPITGANVVESGTTNGTVTDIDGKFSLNVADNTILRVSYIGYETQDVRVGRQSNLSITLAEDNLALEEVVVVGYGVVKKSNLTGAVSSVKMADIPMVTTTSISNLLTGRVPGLTITQTSAEPSGGYSVLIRGATSTGAGNDPLYVIDGFPGGNINTISPNDIESVEVLKDASATAIYGARAANGVILINTKKGKAGTLNVSVQLSTSLQTISNPYDLVSAKDYMRLTNEFYEEEWMFNNKIAPYGSADPSTVATRPVVAFSEQEIASARDITNWFDEISRTGVIDNENISIAGGSEKATYTFSLGHFKHKGVIMKSGYDKYTVRLAADFHLSKWLTTGITISGSQQDADLLEAATRWDDPTGLVRQAIVYPRYLPIKDEDGNYVLNPNHATIPNPVSNKEVTNTRRDNRFLITNFWSARITKDLNFRASWGVNQAFIRNNQHFPKSTLRGSTLNSYAYIKETRGNDYLLDATLTYDKLIFGNHHLKAMAGYAYQTFISESVTASNSDFVSDVYNVYNLGGGGDLTKSVASDKSVTKYLSYFGRLNYDIADKYLFTFTMRADGSDRFGRENRFGYFPSGSFAWRITEEEFMESQETLSNLKLRASIGQTGNSEIGGNAYGYYASGTNYVLGGTLRTGVSENQLASSKLKWETTTEFNFGLDFGLLNNRLTGSFDFFRKTVSDLLDSRNVGSYYPVSAVADNLGATLGQGWEFQLSSVNVRNGQFSWTTDFNISHFKDRWKERNPFTILNVYNTTTDPLHVTWGYVSDGLIQVGDDVSHMPGGVVGTIKLKDLNGWLKDASGNYILDADGRQQLSGVPDGAVDDADKVIIANSQPNLTFGMYNTFRYRGFDLSFFLYGETGRQKYNDNILLDPDKFRFRDNVTTHAFDKWKHDNQDGIYPSGLDLRYAGSNDFWVENADFLRLKTLAFGYTLPQSIFGKAFQNARIYVDFQNLFVLTKYKGSDPETDRIAAYPNQRTYSLGLNLNF
jgi:TonB-linked SusC/RagA family outer membrane protein